MSYTLTHSLTLVTEECFKCHIIFAMPEDLQRRALEAKRNITFYCPNGHGQSYIGETEVQKLRKAVEAERIRTRQARDQAAAADRARAAAKGQVTKIKRRIVRGVCPFCNRQFTNVADHMAEKHPDEVSNAPHQH